MYASDDLLDNDKAVTKSTVYLSNELTTLKQTVPAKTFRKSPVIVTRVDLICLGAETI